MPKSKRRRLTLRNREVLAGFLFILPWLVGVTVFFLFNIVQAVIYSFNTVDFNLGGIGFTLTPQGFSNLRFALLEHGSFNRELVTSLTDMLVNVPLIIFFSLFIAVCLNRKFMGRGVVRAIFFLPVIMATSAIDGSLDAVMRMMMGGASSIPPEIAGQQAGFHPGAIAFMLVDFGVPVIFIGYILDALARLYEIIRATGVQILIFLAALQAIPTSMYEVAQIEGATAYETFWKITFPLVSPLILTNVIYTIVDTFAESSVVETAFNTAFIHQNFGLSAAMSLISSVIACLALLLVGWLISKKVFYQVGD
ncbi:MAG: sugar ABC transporter permease [Defluviitaleaceae bacterium]|nr:sugar ABC transporter permease [Defluviitaleaceae bacterium]